MRLYQDQYKVPTNVSILYRFTKPSLRYIGFWRYCVTGIRVDQCHLVLRQTLRYDDRKEVRRAYMRL